MSKRATHIDADSAASNILSSSLCGFHGVLVTKDASLATCRLCQARVRSGRGARATPRPAPLHLPSAEAVAAELSRELHIAIGACLPALAPHAGFPPRITAELWATSCKGGDKRCGECAICVWERQAQLWSAVAPWNTRHMLAKPEGAPRWPSLSAALCAWTARELHGRSGVGSAMGALLDRLQRGDRGAFHRDPTRNAPMATIQANDLVHIELALSRAYEAGHELAPLDCVRVLLERTGTLDGVTTYEALAAKYGVSEGTLQAIVKHGRAVITEDLAARGLIPAPRIRARNSSAVSITTWRAAEGDSQHAA